MLMTGISPLEGGGRLAREGCYPWDDGRVRARTTRSRPAMRAPAGTYGTEIFRIGIGKIGCPAEKEGEETW